jgi:hypothetical protein
MLFFIHREKGDCVHNSLAIVENIVELRPGVCRGAFYNIICPFYAFLYTQRGRSRCARQPGHCGEHCLLRPGVLFMLFFLHREEGDSVHNSVAIVENIVELGPGVCLKAFYNIICPFLLVLVHNSLTIVENIVELGPDVCRKAFYNIICPFYAFLYTRREGRRCAQQPGQC